VSVDVPEEERRHFVVCGDNPLALRLAGELVTRYAGEVSVILRSAQVGRGPQLAGLDGVDVVVAARPDLRAYHAAGLPDADALALVDQDDGGNIDAALLARELRPDLRIVIRMFNTALGERIAGLVGNCSVLSESAIAAPAFVTAALGEDGTRRVRLSGHDFQLVRRDEVPATDVVCGVAVDSDTDDPELLPADEQLADLVLATAAALEPTGHHHRRRHPLRALALLIGRRMRMVLGALLAILVLASLALAAVDRNLGWWRSAYVVVLSTLGGASPDFTVPAAEQVLQVLLALVSAALIPVITAAVVDTLVNARLRLAAGGLAEPIEGHVVVVGLGNVGARVIRALHQAGIEAVGIDRREGARGVAVARQLRTPVIIGDATHEQTLTAACVGSCRAVLVVSTDDANNLETALLSRTVQPGVRLVLRLFDGEFAERIQRVLRGSASHSVSYLAAPAFAAAMIGQQIIDVVPVRRRVLLVCELGIAPGSELDGAPVQSLHRPHRVRLLGIRTGRGSQVIWSPPRARLLQRTDRVLVLCTRAGLGWLVAAAGEAAPGPAPTSRHTDLGPIGHPRL
jgi:Trk K+ transport system NAD-binding subunit